MIRFYCDRCFEHIDPDAVCSIKSLITRPDRALGKKIENVEFAHLCAKCTDEIYAITKRLWQYKKPDGTGWKLKWVQELVDDPKPQP